jgi:hypothetical protein
MANEQSFFWFFTNLVRGVFKSLFSDALFAFASGFGEFRFDTRSVQKAGLRVASSAL